MDGGSLRKKYCSPRSSRMTAAHSRNSSSSVKCGRNAVLMAFAVICLIIFISVTSQNNFHGSLSTIYSFEIVNEFPHDSSAFTQGLLYEGNDTLLESTGLYGQSSVRRVLLQTGKIQALHAMDDSYFGEGLALVDERLFQVTWLKNTGFIYDKDSLRRLGTFSHQMKDGWGLTTDGNVIFGSDGTSAIYKLDIESLKVLEEVKATYKGLKVSRLNELEYINGELWANIWMSDCIAKISPKDGMVVGWALLHRLREGLLSSGHLDVDCLNGIAWDGEKKRLFVTGKFWPKLYEIKLHPLKHALELPVENLCFSKF